jgi:hypothetical protein
VKPAIWIGLAVLLGGAAAPDAGTPAPASPATVVVFFAAAEVDPELSAGLRDAVLARARAAGPVLDASEQHRALTSPSLFADFSRPPPPFWPESLATSWRAGHEACARQVGPSGEGQPPATRAAAAAVSKTCSEALGLALWDLYLDHLAPRRALEVEVSAPAGQRPDLALAAAAYALGGQRRAAQVARVTPARALQRMGELLDVALSTSANAAVRLSTHTRHPLPSTGDPLPAVLATVKSDRTLPVVPPPSPCPRSVPAHLQVFPPSTVARTLEARYRSSTGSAPAITRAQPLRCDLVLFPGHEPGEPRTVHARLSCAGAQHRASASLQDGPATAAADLTAQLTQRALAAFCAR